MNDDLFPAIRQSELFSMVDDSTWQKISSQLELIDLENGQSLFQQGDPADAMYVVISGQLEVKMSDENGRETVIGKIDPTMLVGEIQAITGGGRTADVYACSYTRLVKIPKSAIEILASDAPETFQKILDIARGRLRNDQLRSLLPTLFGTLNKKALGYIEKHIEWIHLSPGEILCRQGDPGDCIYIVVSGRLRVVKETEDLKDLDLGEIGRGEILGEMALLTGGVRSATVVGLRDSHLVKISRNVFETFANENPNVILLLGQTLARRILRTEEFQHKARTQANLTILAACNDMPLTDFTQRLVRSLSVHASTLHLSSRRLNDMLGLPGIEHIKEEDPFSVRLSAWLTEQETRHDFMVFESDRSDSAWTERCLRNADKIIVLVPGDRPAKDLDTKMVSLLKTEWTEPSKTILVFVHPEATSRPDRSGEWLSLIRAEEHHHLRWGRDADFQRIARFLTGNSVNLVLSGGAAGGLAHIGVIRALEENDVPIDSISGTSMGALIGAQYAMGMGHSELIRTNRWFWVESKPIRDFTLPLISFLRGRKLHQVAKHIYGETQIEDLWLPFFCVSTNLTSAEAVIHRKGRLFNAIRATASVPGLVPPVINNNEILVDGGIMNNLPVDIARRFFKGTVIAVDVTDARSLSTTLTGFPSPWQILWGRMIPFKNRVYSPNIFDIIYRSAVVGSRHKTEKAKQDADLYLRLPLEQFKFLDFESFDEIIDIGYQYANVKIREWKEKSA